jgi:tetrahydromethanopterin S-methyltransferase subunit F
MNTNTVETPISRTDIESKLRELKGEVDSTAQTAKPIGLAVGVATAVVVVGLVYFMGKRRGKKKTTVVEIRRV